ncbi:hypothetical protein RND71_006123 [Anisodus tanguticus]|uniref:Uncharacterized protein n=1 Tax=Anisodus tanguticus TaxID=243964 RepID=A0AAE1VSY5_9SOLA|nr:hypothetical protein RND71_006123 [Anisodus tanguticus]
MWRRLSSQFRTLSPFRSTAKSNRLSAAAATPPPYLPPSRPLSVLRFQSSPATSVLLLNVVKTVEEVMPIATGHEREELEAELQGRDLLDINFPEGPFGTKEAPAVIRSYYDKRIVGCPGDEGEDEHDVVWFWLEKGKPHECPVCSQYFVLEVVGPGGPPDGHGDDDHHH